ncbi:DUF3883 domain-containing protein [Thiomicrorhabdus lithotrophica]|uniref:DUF3883 domain-containing protein n=1 Tax=Thiomicrorhabdus lithotrophica TaxID=2949997 RepID=A0ABY8C9G4_9GAMM|nr:DUF3883 domain-containing protein [Thiomicrorhabdus lithotrophica]WEJ61877.1 DUF3883 domain-containing protein [Thiomicrorhabdus lithotrophica]
MLEEVSKFQSLGSPSIYWELLNNILASESGWNDEDFANFFYNRVIDGKKNFDGCVPFLQACRLISFDENGYVQVDTVIQSNLVNKAYLSNIILDRIFIILASDDAFHRIFSNQYISFDVIYNHVQIDNSAFTFKYSNFKQLLIDFSFLNAHPDKRIQKYFINNEYKKLFDKSILPQKKRGIMGLDELDEILHRQRLYGEEAEKFVVEFEKKRLRHSSNYKKVVQISEYDVNAGYDVVSFNNHESALHDRFIEVKSYIGEYNFFWSDNEIDVSKQKADEYFLYLVNRDEMESEGYVPEIIQNPYKSVFMDSIKWNKRPKKFYVSLNRQYSKVD